MAVYVVSFGGKQSAVDLLKTPPFLLKFSQKLKEGLQKEGTLHSSSVPGLESGELQMGEIRQYVKAMYVPHHARAVNKSNVCFVRSASTKGHQFCLDDGHVVSDSMTLKDYVGSLVSHIYSFYYNFAKQDYSKTVEEEEQSRGTPSINVYFCKPGISRKTKSKGASDEIKNHEALKPDDPGFKVGIRPFLIPKIVTYIAWYAGNRGSQTNTRPGAARNKGRTRRSEI